jgi:hypothetical protein
MVKIVTERGDSFTATAEREVGKNIKSTTKEGLDIEVDDGRKSGGVENRVRASLRNS